LKVFCIIIPLQSWLFFMQGKEGYPK